MKPAPAAEILQEGTLDDTTVAMLMLRLQPQHMAKIMGGMNADFAARITKIIQELR
jgi:flagellar motility protein MotE (MotC chaperone)